MFFSPAGFGTVAGTKAAKKEEEGGEVGPKRILVFKNTLSGFLFLQKSQQGWRKLESTEAKEQVWENMCTSLPQINKRRNAF